MGIDAGIFARKARTYYWFGRLYNLTQPLEHHDETAALYDLLGASAKGLSAPEVRRLTALAAKYWSESENVPYLGMAGVDRFLAKYPHDTLFVVGDNAREWSDLLDTHTDSEGA